MMTGSLAIALLLYVMELGLYNHGHELIPELEECWEDIENDEHRIVRSGERHVFSVARNVKKILCSSVLRYHISNYPLQ